jgi:hypothetical protein
MVSSASYQVNNSVSTPNDLIKIIVLSRWNDLLEAWENFYKTTEQGFKSDLSIVKARSISLYLCISGELSRKSEKSSEYFYKVLIVNKRPNEAELFRVMLELNKILDIDRLIRVDTRPSYDYADVERDNIEGGL